jgi:hypothetical protein
MDVTHAQVHLRLRLELESGDDLVDIARLEGGVDQIRGNALLQEVARRAECENAVGHRLGEAGVEVGTVRLALRRP